MIEIAYSSLPTEIKNLMSENISTSIESSYTITEDGKIKNGNTDIFDLWNIPSSSTIDIDSVSVDKSLLNSYNIFENPLNVRRIQIQNGAFKEDVKIVNNDKTYLFINADKISCKVKVNNTTQTTSIDLSLSENNMFKTYASSTFNIISITNLLFYYKPYYLIRSNIASIGEKLIFRNASTPLILNIVKNKNNEFELIYNEEGNSIGSVFSLSEDVSYIEVVG